MKTCLVTGGAGFIGSHLADALVQAGHRVRILDDFSSGSRGNLTGPAAAAEVTEGDLRSLETVRRSVEGCDAVFHLGALGSVPRSVKNPLPTHDVNVTGSLNVLLAARDAGVRRVLLASSSSVYGDAPGLVKREDVLGSALSPYAVSKRAMELYAGVFAARYGLETVVLRYFNVFGPRQNPDSAYAAVVPLFFKAGFSKEPPVVFGDGEQSRDFTYVGDVVRANLLAAEAPLPEGTHLVVNVARGGNVTVNRLWQVIAALTASAARAEHGPPRAGDVRQSSADAARLRAWLGWVPETPLEDGLERSLPYYRQHALGLHQRV